MGAYYIVTDLEIRARFEFSPLDAALRQAGLHGGVSKGCNGEWRANYSSSRRCCRHPAEAIDELVAIIERLDGPERVLWDRCYSRRFDMGFHASDERLSSRWQISTALMRRIVEVQGDLVVTIYRRDAYGAEKETGDGLSTNPDSDSTTQ